MALFAFAPISADAFKTRNGKPVMIRFAEDTPTDLQVIEAHPTSG